jgi:hypothetical protein
MGAGRLFRALADSSFGSTQGQLQDPAQEDILNVTTASTESCSNIIGERVLISGLVNSPQFNGQWGKVESYDAEMERYVVRVFLAGTGGEVLAKLRPSSILIPMG